MQDVNDELADMLEQADEVQEAMGRQYGMPEIDDDELAAELDALGMYWKNLEVLNKRGLEGTRRGVVASK